MKLKMLGGMLLTYLAVSATPGFAQGVKTLDLAKIVVGARQAAMGGAFVGIGDDINTLAANPAGLSLVNRYSVSGSVNDWIAGSSYGFATVGLPRKIGTFAASLSYFNQTEVEVTDHSGTPTGEFSSAYDVRIALGYGAMLHRRVHFGTAITLTQNKLGDETKGYGALDLGFVFPVMENRLRLGIAARNLAADALKTTPDTGEDLPPTSVSAGLGLLIHDMESVKFNIGADVYMPMGDGSTKGNVGAEAIIKDMVALRLGYRANYDEEALALGAGIHYKDFWVDYAYSALDLLDDAHRFTVRMDFGGYQEKMPMIGSELDRGDADGDGIENYLDRCKMDPEDKDGYEDYDGCPDPDNDHDGIPDKDDKCPLMPETFNSYEDADGCPDMGAMITPPTKGNYGEIYGAEGYRLDARYSYIVPIYFDTDKATLRQEAYPLLEEVSKLINQNDVEGIIFVEGHTDNRNNSDYNQDLSERRAKAVKEALVTRYSVPADILVPIGLGETQPVAPNDAEDNMQKNRRVVFRVWEKAEIKN